MKLKEMFTSNENLLRDALKRFDVDLVRRLRTKKDNFLEYSVLALDFAKYPREMAELFVREFSESDWRNWGFRDDRNAVLTMLMVKSMAAGRDDLFDLYFGSIPGFNKGGANGHVISAILQSDMQNDTKTRLVGTLVAAGIDKVAFAYVFLQEAVEKSATGAFDLLAEALKPDVHANNEALLRHAAVRGQKDMIRHLVEKYGANIELAITTDRTAGIDKSWHVLEEVRQELRPGDGTPPTIESLSDELKQLRAEMREMKAELAAQRAAPSVLGKPALSQPTLQ